MQQYEHVTMFRACHIAPCFAVRAHTLAQQHWLLRTDVCYVRVEMHHFFVEVPHFRELKISPKNRSWRKIKLPPVEKSHGGLGTQRKSREKKMAYFRRFWVEEPRHSRTISGDKYMLPLSQHVSMADVAIVTPRFGHLKHAAVEVHQP